jgi:hypothetical protein
MVHRMGAVRDGIGAAGWQISCHETLPEAFSGLPLVLANPLSQFDGLLWPCSSRCMDARGFSGKRFFWFPRAPRQSSSPPAELHSR